MRDTSKLIAKHAQDSLSRKIFNSRPYIMDSEAGIRQRKFAGQ